MTDPTGIPTLTPVPLLTRAWLHDALLWKPALLLLAGLAMPSVAWGAAWTREPGEVYAKASAAWLDASEMYDDEGRIRPIQDTLLYAAPSYRELWSSVYVEYGLRRSLTLVAGLPFKIARQNATGRLGAPDIEGETIGFGSMRIGVRAPLHRGRWRASFEPEWHVPLYGEPDRVEDPRLGTGFMDLGAALSAGTGVPAISGYAQGTAGYRIRGGSTPEETFWDLELGAEPVRRLFLRLRYDGLSSKGDLIEVPPGATPTPGLGGQDHHRLAPTVALATGTGSEISVTWRRVVDGRSTLRSTEWEVAFAFLGWIRGGEGSAP